MNTEALSSYLLSIVYGWMMVIPLFYRWQANRQGGKAVRRIEPGWSPVLMSVLLLVFFLAGGAPGSRHSCI